MLIPSRRTRLSPLWDAARDDGIRTVLTARKHVSKSRTDRPDDINIPPIITRRELSDYLLTLSSTRANANVEVDELKKNLYTQQIEGESRGGRFVLVSIVDDFARE